MKRKILSIVMALVLCLGLLPGTAAAEAVSWTDGLTQAPEGYTEDESSITVSTPEALAWLSVQVNGLNGTEANSFKGKTVLLGGDIDLQGKNWTPIGKSDTKFEGNFDGQGHTISNMTIRANNEEKYIGLFGQVSFVGEDLDDPSFIKDVNLENVDIETDNIKTFSYIGALAGEAFSGRGKISGCTASGNINCLTAHSGMNAGGLIGFINALSYLMSGDSTTADENAYTVWVDDCFADVDITGASQSTGGFFGCSSEWAKITNCGASGDITVNAPSGSSPAAGGFAGELSIMQDGQFLMKNCYSTGKVSMVSDGSQPTVGGFLGANAWSGGRGVVDGCMSSGDVSLSSDKGNMLLIGGFAGTVSAASLEIRNCYSSGDVNVSGGTYALGGGFIGHSTHDISDCFALGNVTAGGGSGLSRAFGFSGNTPGGSYTNCYALGAVMDSDSKADVFLIGANATLSDCHYYELMELKGEATANSAVESLSADELMSGEAFSGFDDEIWQLSSSGLPILKGIPDEVERTDKPDYLITVTFDTRGGSAVESQRVVSGGTVAEPESPTRTGYTFGGWYREESCTTAWDFDADTVTEGITLYAKWTQNQSGTGTGSGPSGSSSGGGGGSSSPAALPVSTDTTTRDGAPVTETTARPIAVTGSGTAKASVSAAIGDEIVRQAVANGSESVIISPQISGGVTETEVSIPAFVLGQLGEKTSAGIVVSTPVADVAIPNGALDSLSGRGGTVTVRAQQEGNSVELTVTADGKTAENIPGGLTLTVPVLDTVPGTVAVLVHEDGTRQVVRKSVADGESVIIPLDGSAALEIVDNSKQFSDVPAGSWAADAVVFASARELFSGTGGGQFSPDLLMSRGMLAVVLYNLEGNPEQALANEFTDVSNSTWYAQGVAWAASNGIVNGYGNGLFGPDEGITREQLAVMLWRYAGRPAANKELNFQDADAVSGYALEAVRWAVANGVLNGYGNGLLAPRGLATRAQVAQMLKNYMSK